MSDFSYRSWAKNLTLISKNENDATKGTKQGLPAVYPGYNIFISD